MALKPFEFAASAHVGSVWIPPPPPEEQERFPEQTTVAEARPAMSVYMW